MTAFTTVEDCIAHVRELMGDSQHKLFNPDFVWGLLYTIQRLRRDITEIDIQLKQYQDWTIENHEKHDRVHAWQQKGTNGQDWWSYKITYPGDPNDLIIKNWDRDHQHALFYHRQDLIDVLYTNLYKLIVDNHSSVERNVGALIELYEENKRLLRRHYIKTLCTAENTAKKESDRIHREMIEEANKTGAICTRVYSTPYAWPFSHWKSCYRDLNKHIAFYKNSFSSRTGLGGRIKAIRNGWTAHMGDTSWAMRNAMSLQDLDAAINFAHDFLRDFTLVITHASNGTLSGEKEWPAKLFSKATYKTHKSGPPPRPNWLRRIQNWIIIKNRIRTHKNPYTQEEV